MELKLEQVIDAESLFTEMVAFSPTSLTAERKQKYQYHQSLKCPRCDSCNTKFCYYNNYRLTQPRHFCKSCKRYWTKGGTLRNVPVGGGCRKNKKSKQINTGQKRKGVIENTCKRIADRGSAAKTSCNLSATHAPAFSNNKCSSSSNIDLSHNVITSCWIPGYLRFPSDREEIMKLPSDGITKSSYDSPKFQNSQVESSTNSVITLTSTGEEERARIVFTGENSFRNLLTSDVRYVRSDHQESSISNSLILNSPDFSNYPLLTGYSTPDSALLDATFSTSQWLDQIATHNNENADPSQIYGALAHSMPSSSQPQKIVDPIIEMGLMNCFKVWPQWRMQNDEYQQISPEEGKPNTVHADQLVEVSESEALYKCMIDASAERLSKIEGGKVSFLDNTVWDWQLDPEGLIWASELCYMGGLRVRPELPQFDV